MTYMTYLFIFGQIKTGGQIPMRWFIARQRHLPLSCQDGLSCRTVSGSFGEVSPASIIKVSQVIKRPMEQVDRVQKKLYYLDRHVNNFTYSRCPAFARSFCKSYSYAPSSQRPPSRTIRRVHVMPWATPIRRIGSMRINCIEPDGDEPAAFGRRRLPIAGV